MTDAALDASRRERLARWAAARHALAPDALDLRLAAGDASFRRYFRLVLPDDTTRILMDAPPEQEDSQPFVAIARRWEAAGLPVPHLHAVDLEAGFIELEDLGDTPLQCCFDDEGEALAWHERAIALLHELQNRAGPDDLPRFDAALLERELELFPEWCLGEWLGLATPPGWTALRQALVAQALAQPMVTVHRDFDAMNLMVRDASLVLIDFQDAVAGPISYDLISLLRGRYCRFDAGALRRLGRGLPPLRRGRRPSPLEHHRGHLPGPGQRHGRPALAQGAGHLLPPDPARPQDGLPRTPAPLPRSPRGEPGRRGGA